VSCEHSGEVLDSRGGDDLGVLVTPDTAVYHGVALCGTCGWAGAISGSLDRPVLMPDHDVPLQRVVFGARCSWWDTIDKAATRPDVFGTGLPCCPHCRGVLLEVENEVQWWATAELYQANGHTGYVDFLRWIRGRCFPTMDEAWLAWEQHERDNAE
jgi:hypothetical protein